MANRKSSMMLMVLQLTLAAVCLSAKADDALNLLPTPKVLKVDGGKMPLTAASRIVAGDPGLEPLATILSDEVWMITNMRLAVGKGQAKPGDIMLKVNPGLRADEDILAVQKKDGKPEVLRTRDFAHTVSVGETADVSGWDYRAVCEGTATLLQAITQDGDRVTIPKMTIKDWPEADYAAIMVDVGRQYIPISALRQVIQACRVYKVRYLQLHMSDDQGWTFPSKAFPALGTRNFAAHGGIAPRVYDPDELRQLVAFADARGITIVPELETPGHSSAMRRAMPELFASLDAAGNPVDLPIINIGSQKMYAALDTLVGEMCDVFRSSPYFHIGVDETRMGNIADLPESKALMAAKGLHGPGELFNYFVCQMNEFVKKRGRKTIIWEGAGNGASPDIINMTWDGNARTAERLVSAGITTITVPWNLGVPWPEWTMYICNGSVLKRGDSVLGAMLPMWEMNAEALINGYITGIPARQERTWNPAHSFTEEDFQRRSKATEALVSRLIRTVQIRVDGLFDVDRQAGTDKGNIFDKCLTVSLESPVKEGEIRYTLEPASAGNSTAVRDDEAPAGWCKYAAPVKVTNSALIKACLFSRDGKKIGFVNSGTFRYVSCETNLTTGKPVTVSSTEAEYKGEFAVDGMVLRERAWWANPYPQWLQVDLQKAYMIDRVHVFPFWDGHRYYQYTVELSVDGKTWKQIVDMSTNTRPSVEQGDMFRFEPAEGRYIRVNMLRNSANPGVHIVEVRAYASGK